MYSNPIVLSILSILKDTDESISLYKLIKILEESGYDLSESDANECNEVILFRKNFIVMNALYQLNQELIESGYTLLISSLNIKIIALNSPHEILSEDVSADVALSEYYLNWDNYHNTGKADIEVLLNGFWKQFSEYSKFQNGKDKRLDSLTVLGLESAASWKDIQQTYRQLVKQYHPDKGGNSLKFIEIRNAYLVLKLTQNISQ